ncbi:TetR/AcrR family transcriptional regulator [Streptomyces sp. NPDC002537]
MATTAQPRLRADAVRNRERIVAAAREVFVEHGVDTSLDLIARRAGVGNATLYRHFADRAELIRHVTLFVLDRLADRAEAARAEEPDAFHALSRFVHAAVDERVGALCSLFAESVDPTHPDHIAASERLDSALEELMAAARASGQLRADVALGDVMIALAQLTRPLPGKGCATFDEFVHRHVQVFLDGLMAPARSELPGTAATLEDLRRKECCG